MFDSGVGGLTVLHELLVSLPAEDYLYLGDTAHFPYGDRSDAELQEFSLRIAEHLLGQGAKLLVVACNSASAAAFETLERWLERTAPEIDVIGVLRPAAQLAVVATHNGRIGLLATPATVATAATSGRSAPPTRMCTSRALRARIWPRSSSLASRSTSPCRYGSQVLRTAASGSRRHRDPRLDPLSPVRPDSAADARAAG